MNKEINCRNDAINYTKGAYDMDFAMHILDNVLEMIARCDSKISYLLSAMSLVTVFEVSAINFSSFNLFTLKKLTFLNFVGIFFFLLGAVFTIISIFLSVKSLSPKLKIQSSDNKIVMDSLLYFGSIAVTDYNKYRKKCNNISDTDLYDDILSQIYINSIIANQKYSMLKRNSISFVISFICLLIVIILQSCF